MYKILTKPLFLGKRVICMPTCHSTNDIAADLAKKPDIQEGTLVITNKQEGGRGQMGNVWESQPDSNLTFSLVLKPKFLLVKDQFYLNMIISLAIRDTVAKYLPNDNCKVKWPNDVYLNAHKVAGVLIENTLRAATLETTIVGIGLNVNQHKFGINKATSLSIISGEIYELPLVLETLVAYIEYWYLRLKSGHYSSIKADYLQHLYGYRQERPYLSEYKFNGVIEDVSDEGKLQIKTKGKRVLFDFKEVQFLY